MSAPLKRLGLSKRTASTALGPKASTTLPPISQQSLGAKRPAPRAGGSKTRKPSSESESDGESDEESEFESEVENDDSGVGSGADGEEDSEDCSQDDDKVESQSRSKQAGEHGSDSLRGKLVANSCPADINAQYNESRECCSTSNAARDAMEEQGGSSNADKHFSSAPSMSGGSDQHSASSAGSRPKSKLTLGKRSAS